MYGFLALIVTTSFGSGYCLFFTVSFISISFDFGRFSLHLFAFVLKLLTLSWIFIEKPIRLPIIFPGKANYNSINVSIPSSNIQNSTDSSIAITYKCELQLWFLEKSSPSQIFEFLVLTLSGVFVLRSSSILLYSFWYLFVILLVILLSSPMSMLSWIRSLTSALIFSCLFLKHLIVCAYYHFC